jgi:hypothetical protein
MSDENNDDSSDDETTFKFFCDYCDYGTKYEHHFTKHLNTNKHCENIELFKKQENSTKFKCTNCNNYYKNKTSMYRHRKDCIPEPSGGFVTGEEFTKAMMVFAEKNQIFQNNVLESNSNFQNNMLKTNSEYQSNMLKANTENNANMLKANTENTKAIVDACAPRYSRAPPMKTHANILLLVLMTRPNLVSSKVYHGNRYLRFKAVSFGLPLS